MRNENLFAAVCSSAVASRFARRLILSLFAIGAMALPAGAEPILKDGDVLAICGDSITEQKQYSVFIEDYLLMCQPAKVKVIQFGWGGERAPFFAGRMKNDVLILHPTVATTCYGMNDGNYRAIDDSTRKTYRDGMTQVVRQFKEAGVRVVVGSPGVVDADTYKRAGDSAAIYNQTLSALKDEAREIAAKEGQIFADVHTPMMQTMTEAKARLGSAYHVAGGDGVHPGANGHLVMAYAFLKSLGFTGDIGTITVDLAKNEAQTTGGHKVVGVEPGVVTIESTQYPFCLTGDPKNPAATTGIVEFFPFNQELNRLTLKVASTSAPKYRVTWGPTSREYTAEQLQAGINLAGDFIQNPFSGPFNQIEQKIRSKQAFETSAFKYVWHSLNDIRAQLKNDEAIASFWKSMAKAHQDQVDQLATMLAPVTHTIKIEPVQ